MAARIPAIGLYRFQLSPLSALVFAVSTHKTYVRLALKSVGLTAVWYWPKLKPKLCRGHARVYSRSRTTFS